ncbi:MAG: M12 family metallo-peptidase, partial [Candidatus Melainabacteria bacterium]|nr:M12 family metallo-peptidase [Candidatus Melainabacteria bacterium]
MLSYSAKIFLFSLIFLANANHSFAHASKNIFKTIKHNPNATKVHGSGLIKLVFVDAAIDDVAEPIIYKLESKGTIKPVQFKSGLKKPQENTFIKYSGYELNNKVYINDYKTDNKKFAILEESTVNDVTGTHKLLVVKVSDGTKDSPTYGYSDNELREFYSTGSNNMVDFYKEASSNNLNLEVEYYDPILTVNNLCLASEDSPMDNDEYLNAITRLEEDYGSLADVSFVSFVVPDNQTCLASGLLGVATLGKESFTLSNGNKLLSANFINSDHVNVSSENEYGLDIRYAVFHELGHNLGMHHDNAHVCGEEILSSPCYSLEYGGSHSIMGFSPSYAHPNTTYKEKMGWLSSSEIQSLSGTSFVEEVDLYPVSSGGTGTKLIKVDRGDGIFYNMEYREAVGYDGKILPTRTYNNGGFLVYYEDPSITNTILMDSKFKDRRRYMDFLLGDRYI